MRTTLVSQSESVRVPNLDAVVVLMCRSIQAVCVIALVNPPSSWAIVRGNMYPRNPYGSSHFWFPLGRTEYKDRCSSSAFFRSSCAFLRACSALILSFCALALARLASLAFSSSDDGDRDLQV